MTAYQQGVRLEKRVAAVLRSDGYWTVESRGSHGIADLVALKDGQILIVQCKLRNALLSPADRLCLIDCARKTGGLPIVAYRPTPRTVAFRRLTGPGPRDWAPFLSDEVAS